MPFKFVFFIALSYLSILSSAKTLIDTNTKTFIDENERSLIFRGVNAVYKVAPYHPTVSGYDTSSTLSEIDAIQLRSWGFNIVRLGVMWPGVEPNKQGEYNSTYLDQLEAIVLNLKNQDINVILDFHQDILHRKFCGEGVPDYIYSLCIETEPAETQTFPLPARNSTDYPVDSDGNPTLDWCLETSFITYYLSAEVGAAFQCLYDNQNNVLWDAFAGYWQQVALRFHNFDNVLGYELINEPWAGDIYKKPQSLLPKYAEVNYLQPLYEYIHKKIREIDDQKIIFFEGLTISYWPTGFTAGPGGSDYNDRQAMSYHIYCPLSIEVPFNKSDVALEIACTTIDDEFFYMRNKDSQTLGVPIIITEFGAVEDNLGDLINLETVLRLADKHQQSWMYWQYKSYEDITTMTPKGETLFNDDGTVCIDKLRILSRTYPQKVAGILDSFEFNVKTAIFNMKYQLRSLDISLSTTTTTSQLYYTSEIYVNRDLFYNFPPHIIGVHIELSEGADKNIDVVCGENIIQLIQTQTLIDNDRMIEVKISPCHVTQTMACSCPNNKLL